MKRILVGLMLLLSMSISSQSFVEVPEDRLYHLGAGAVFGMPGYFIGLDITDGDRKEAIAIGTLIGTGVNVMKEVTDIGKTGFDTTDVVFGAVGSYISAYVTDKLFYKNWRDNKLQEIEELEKKRLASMTDEEKLLSGDI